MMLAISVLTAVIAGPPAQIQLATATDCAVLVAIGKSQVGWGVDPPRSPLVNTGPLGDGVEYRQDCDWRRLGVAAPKIIAPDATGPRFAVTKPTYSPDRRGATADLYLGAWNGPGEPSFIEVRTCHLRHKDRTWHVVRCDRGPIT